MVDTANWGAEMAPRGLCALPATTLDAAPQVDLEESRATGTATLERMARLLRDNERLFDELGVTLRRLRQTREYIKAPHASLELGQVLVERLRRRRLSLLGRLRANRLEAYGLLGLPTNEADVLIQLHESDSNAL